MLKLATGTEVSNPFEILEQIQLAPFDNPNLKSFRKMKFDEYRKALFELVDLV